MSKFVDILKKNLLNHNANIGIIGLGYVGLPLALTFVNNGFKVFGFDTDEIKINNLKKRKSYISHIPSETIKSLFNNSNSNFSSSFEEIRNCEAIIICVPTPLSKFRDPDLSYIKNSLNSIKEYVHKGQIISLESTTYPGTTEEIILKFLRELNFNVGEDYFLVYSPEREDPGNKEFITANIPKVVGGITNNCALIGKTLYDSIISKVVLVSNTRTAEMTKLLENIHRSVNIGLVNELKPLADKMSINIFEVINAAATKPFGFVPYYPGPGLGGHCIPIDPFYLTWKAREYGMHTRFIELAGEINSSMPTYVINKINNALNTQGKALKNSKILLLGLAYKKDVDDYRESPSITIVKELHKADSLVSYSDPFIEECDLISTYLEEKKSVKITKENLLTFDIVILLTNHTNYDYELIYEYSKMIVDTRGKFPLSEKVVSA